MLLALGLALAWGCKASEGQFDPPEDSGVVMDGGVQVDLGTPSEPDAGVEPDAGEVAFIALPEETQRAGDPQAGYLALVNDGYVGCGLPKSAYDQVTGPAPERLRLPGRNADNATLPYDVSAFTTRSGVSVVAANCFTCHAAQLNGEVIIGLGDSLRDFTNDPSQSAELAGLLITDPAERTEWQKWLERVQTTAPYIQMPVIGTNPADNLAAILFAHRNPQTLEWSSTPLLDPPPRLIAPVDVPPWWRMKKKNAMFYSGAGRGDHARIMMTASVLCVDSVEEAEEIDAYFPDVRAYIESLEAPAYPGDIDSALAEEGRGHFEMHCARCHGTYAGEGSYPNLLIPLEEVGTDTLLAAGTSQFATRFVDWFNGSFYGEIARLEPGEGYVAPPLDGIWATAPYLHNGSVPDIETLLNSETRPTYWTRSFSSSDYNVETLGWSYTELPSGHAEETDPAARKRIYDTNLPGHSNSGHEYGDVLEAQERSALIEYLKTL